MNLKLSARALAALFAMLLFGGFCGHAGADTSVSACGTLSTPGNYVLSANLTATGDCLVIAANNVAIDLKGKKITGDGTGAAVTDDGSARNFAVIANGTISNFATGINLAHSGQAIISNLNSSKNMSDGIFIKQCCNTLNSVTTNNNGGTGIFINNEYSSLSKIQANGNAGGGIHITECCNTLVASTISNNTGIGAEMDGCCSFVIASKIQKNSGDGFEANNCCNGFIKSSSAHNAGDGMDLTGGDNMVTASKSTGNGIVGIDMPSSKWGIFSGVQASMNKGDGVDMVCRGSTASLTALKNSGTNLVQTIPLHEFACANVNLKAP